MKKNEYQTLDEFVQQYTGEWAPSEGRWYGLDFSYKGEEYRFHTGSMYGNSSQKVGNNTLFGIYKKQIITSKDNREYLLLAEFMSMEEALESKVIDNRPFKEVIMDDETELLGQD